MTPTNKLRFVERTVPMHPFYKNYDSSGKLVQATQTYRILQQWWEHTEWNAPGTWRDVPVETEE